MNLLASIIIIQDKLSHQQKDKYKVSTINRLASRLMPVLSPFQINWAINSLTRTKYHDKYKVSNINRLASISWFLRPFSSACANLDPRSVMRGTRYFLIHKTKTKHLGYCKIAKAAVILSITDDSRNRR